MAETLGNRVRVVNKVAFIFDQKFKHVKIYRVQNNFIAQRIWLVHILISNIFRNSQ